MRYSELEAWVLDRFKDARALPEWSKGWAYTPDQGPWTSTKYFDHVHQAFSDGTGQDDWKYAATTLAKYDLGNLFTNPLLTQLFGAASSVR